MYHRPANFCKDHRKHRRIGAKPFPKHCTKLQKPSVAQYACYISKAKHRCHTIQHGIPSETTTYKSIDTVENQDEVVNYPTEFLDSLDLPGMPPHVLTLKIGVPIILLRNINPSRLCNGTRLSQENDEQCYRGNNFDWKIQ
ncbi:ATP-dependent DNA helicase, partial [Trichonephila clavipes]